MIFNTLSCSGKLILHSRIGEVLEFICSKSIISSEFLTNGTMLSIPEVRDAASLANVVKVSQSAQDQASFGWMNRPYQQLRFDNLVERRKAFKQGLKGEE